MTEGLRWARNVLDQLGRVVLVVGIAVGVTVGGVLLHKPWWFVGGLLLAVLVILFFEGAYRVAKMTSIDARAALLGSAADGKPIRDQLLQLADEVAGIPERAVLDNPDATSEAAQIQENVNRTLGSYSDDDRTLAELEAIKFYYDHGFRNRAIGLVNMAITAGLATDDHRAIVMKPRTVDEVEQTLRDIWQGASTA
jgi:hypothetical protein